MSNFKLSFGAQLIAPDQTRFRLWAPNTPQVHLEIEGQDPLPMQPREAGWFEATAPCGAGSCYRYRISPDLAVPDPASHAQAGDVHDASIVWDHAAYRWLHPGWAGRPWEETILYEAHVGALGGFGALAARLPDLAQLGITAIELMPVADFPGARNWGYDGVLPYAPDAAYGSPDDLKALIDTAHGLGMMVFLDVVYNHFGPDGNYLSAYCADFFREDLQTPWGQAIDFRLRPVRDFFIENALYWLAEYRFDGLRFDAVHAISEKDFLEELALRVRTTLPGRHIHLVLENDENSARLLSRDPVRLYDAQWNDDMHHALHVLLTGESEGYYAGYTEATAEKLARGLGEGFIYQGEAPLYPGGEPRGEPSAHLPPTSFVVFLQNHDQIGNRAFGERLTTLAAPGALRAAMGLLLLAPSIPMLYMGEEYGARQPFLYFTSHLTQDLADAVRNGRRQEFARFSAFSDPEKRERIPDPNAESAFLDSIPQPNNPDAAEWRAWVQTLIALRTRDIMPRLAGTASLGCSVLGPKAVLGRWRMGDGSVLALALNLAPEAVALPVLTGSGAARVLLHTEGVATSLTEGRLSGYAFLATLEPADA